MFSVAIGLFKENAWVGYSYQYSYIANKKYTAKIHCSIHILQSACMHKIRDKIMILVKIRYIQLKFHSYVSMITSKANRILGMIKKNFTTCKLNQLVHFTFVVQTPRQVAQWPIISCFIALCKVCKEF